MSTRKVLVELSKVATRASIAKASPPPSLARLFSTQKEKINSDSEKIKNSNEQHQTIPPKNLTEFPFPEATDRAKINNNLNGVSLETADLSAVVLENMASGRFSTKVIDIPSGTYAETSVAGSDVLLSTYTDRDTSYSRKTKCSTYLLDARTGEQKQIDQFCSLITHSYLVDGCNGNLKIWRRPDYSLMTVSLPGGIPEYARWVSNNRSSYETMLIDGAYPLLIDLHTGNHMTIYKVKGGFDMQMCGALIAYKVDYQNPILQIYDYQSREDLFKRKISLHTEYYLMDNKIALAEFNGDYMNWAIMDFQGNIIKEGSFTSSTSTRYFRSVSIHKNFLIINQGPRIHFVDINSGKKLASLKADGYANYNHVVGFDCGKFICTTEYHVQIVNFETPDQATTQPVKVVVLNTNGNTMSPKIGTVSDMVNGLRYQYNDARDFLEFQFNYGPIKETVMVHLNEKERINYVHFNAGVNKAGSEDSILFQNIYKASSKTKPKYNFNLTLVSDSTVKFFGRGLLYKEELVNDQWKPVNLSIKQAEEFINSL